MAIRLLTLARLRDAGLAHRCLLRISTDPSLLEWFHSQPPQFTGSELFSQTQNFMTPAAPTPKRPRDDEDDTQNVLLLPDDMEESLVQFLSQRHNNTPTTERFISWCSD